MNRNDLSVALEHEARVNYAEFSPDGNRIVTASWDKTARLWDARTGRPIGEPLRHDAEVNWATFDRSGGRVATASRDKTARLWSGLTGETLVAPLVHSNPLGESYSIEFSPEGGRLVTIAGDKVQVWAVPSGKSLMGPLHANALLLTVRFSPDGKRLVTASNDGVACVWDAATGYQLSEPWRHEGRVTHAEFDRDGALVATSSWDDTVRLWPIVAAPLPAPDWLLDLAEALAGQRINQNNVSEVVPVMSLFRLRQTLTTQRLEKGYFGRWANWFFSDNDRHSSSSFIEMVAPEAPVAERGAIAQPPSKP
jgi:WD40 repeat protein